MRIRRKKMREEEQKKHREIVEALELYGWKKTRSGKYGERGGYEFYEHDGMLARVYMYTYEKPLKDYIAIYVRTYFTFRDDIENVNIGYKEVADKEGTRKVPVYLQFGDGMRYDATLYLQDGSVELSYKQRTFL